MATVSRNALSSLRDILVDGRFLYAVKFGLAGVLAVFIALCNRLPEPTWALFTVFVLMVAQYVGAIAEKSFFRVVGTVVGGLIGYFLTASLEQNPVIYLLLVGVVVSFCTAMFGQSKYPYAFLLCGLTTVVVTSNGLANPDNSWEYMLFRTEEVCVGIVATMIIQCLFWPRYARLEFSTSSKAAFIDLRDCFTASARIFLGPGDPGATARAENFPARITGLRALLDFAGRESHSFRERLPTYFEITSCLSRIASAIVTIGETLPENSLYRAAISESTPALHRALAESLSDLGSPESSVESRKARRDAVASAFATVENQLTALRSNPALFKVAPGEAMTVGLHLLALDDIRNQIHRAHALVDSLPLNPLEHSFEMEPFVSPIPPRFWIFSGIKSGIAVIIALILYNWLNPPGGTMLVLGTWVFTATNASSPGGQGDRRTFHYAVVSILAVLLLSIILIAASPILSSYAVMNIIIFTWLFVWGYLSYTTHGMTIPMQVGMLCLVSILGLNGQQAVPFQSIAGFFFGIAFATLVAALIQRLLWPSLPQWEMRNRFMELLGTCRDLLEKGPDNMPLWRKVRVALIPGEISQRVAVLQQPICPVGEPERLSNYLHTLQRIASHLIVTAGTLDQLLPPQDAERGKALIRDFETTIEQHLSAHERSMRDTTPLSLDTAPLSPLIEAWQTWVHDLRAGMIERQTPILEIVRIMGHSGRYELAGRDLIQAGEQARLLRMPLYMGDYVL
ncbi:hypothetical protein BH09VER1_BH09VER1_20950 [soil metagenome]